MAGSAGLLPVCERRGTRKLNYQHHNLFDELLDDTWEQAENEQDEIEEFFENSCDDDNNNNALGSKDESKKKITEPMHKFAKL